MTKMYVIRNYFKEYGCRNYYEITDNLLVVYYIPKLIDTVHTTKGHYRIKSSNIRHSSFNLCKKKNPIFYQTNLIKIFS